MSDPWGIKPRRVKLFAHNDGGWQYYGSYETVENAEAAKKRLRATTSIFSDYWVLIEP